MKNYIFFLSLLLFISEQSQAQIFLYHDPSASSLGSASSASTVNLHDISGQFTNPAILNSFKYQFISFSYNILQKNFKLNNIKAFYPSREEFLENSNKSYSKPFFYFEQNSIKNKSLSMLPAFASVYPMNEKISFGLILSTPWFFDIDYDKQWIGKYHILSSDFKFDNASLSLSYKINELTFLAFGLQIQHASMNLSQKIDGVLLSKNKSYDISNELEKTMDLTSKYSSEHLGYGYILGVLLKPLEDLTIGVSFRSSVHHQTKGDLKIETSSEYSQNLFQADEKYSASLSLMTPSLLSLGFSYNLNKIHTLLLNSSVTAWQSIKNLNIKNDLISLKSTFENKALISLSLGYEYFCQNKLTLRTGISLKNNTTNDHYRSPSSLDSSEIKTALGFSYPLESFSLMIHGGYALSFSKKTSIDLTRAEDKNNFEKGDLKAEVNMNTQEFLLSFSVKI